eukprot:6214228-Pleurochrysis_carterae.AAC.1
MAMLHSSIKLKGKFRERAVTNVFKGLQLEQSTIDDIGCTVGHRTDSCQCRPSIRQRLPRPAACPMHDAIQGTTLIRTSTRR